jgi:Holliday junction resolvase-like predicted endonuclease
VENPGEELVGSYLRAVLECDFVEYNLSTRFTQGEIDIIGISSVKKIVYLCEVATHLETGLQYVRERRPDNIIRFVKKFEKDIRYATTYFSEFKKEFMLWSPIVKSSKEDSIYNQVVDIEQIKKIVKEKYDVELIVILNEEYMKCIKRLREAAMKRTDEIKTPIMRFLQIEEKLNAHLERKRKAALRFDHSDKTYNK